MRMNGSNKILCIGFFLLLGAAAGQAQFNSGSTGADGTLDLATMNCPDNVCKVVLPESGVLHYTTINIPAGRELRFIGNSHNTPATMLAQGLVLINGSISVSSFGQTGHGGSCSFVPAELAPGAFRGGQAGMNGFGPGGGTSTDPHGKWVGPLSLVPMVGGSGGGGWINGFGGGRGGGALLIASSSTVTGSGSIYALGSRDCSQGGNGLFFGSQGSGGAIRIVANSINYSGVFNACTGFCGVVRLEATSLVFTGSSTPAAVLGPINPTVIPASVPVLSISTVGGYEVPSFAGTRTDTVDMLLPNQLTDPINVQVSANNIPTGAPVNVGLVSGSPSGTSTPCLLAGTFAASSCTATISNLNRPGVTYLLATAAFSPPAVVARFNPKGTHHVAQIRLEARIGGKPKYLFLSEKGTVVDRRELAKGFLDFFGM